MKVKMYLTLLVYLISLSFNNIVNSELDEKFESYNIMDLDDKLITQENYANDDDSAKELEYNIMDDEMMGISLAENTFPKENFKNEIVIHNYEDIKLKLENIKDNKLKHIIFNDTVVTIGKIRRMVGKKGTELLNINFKCSKVLPSDMKKQKEEFENGIRTLDTLKNSIKIIYLNKIGKINVKSIIKIVKICKEIKYYEQNVLIKTRGNTEIFRYKFDEDLSNMNGCNNEGKANLDNIISLLNNCLDEIKANRIRKQEEKIKTEQKTKDNKIAITTVKITTTTEKMLNKNKHKDTANQDNNKIPALNNEDTKIMNIEKNIQDRCNRVITDFEFYKARSYKNSKILLPENNNCNEINTIQCNDIFTDDDIKWAISKCKIDNETMYNLEFWDGIRKTNKMCWPEENTNTNIMMEDLNIRFLKDKFNYDFINSMNCIKMCLPSTCCNENKRNIIEFGIDNNNRIKIVLCEKCFCRNTENKCQTRINSEGNKIHLTLTSNFGHYKINFNNEERKGSFPWETIISFELNEPGLIHIFGICNNDIIDKKMIWTLNEYCENKYGGFLEHPWKFYCKNSKTLNSLFKIELSLIVIYILENLFNKLMTIILSIIIIPFVVLLRSKIVCRNCCKIKSFCHKCNYKKCSICGENIMSKRNYDNANESKKFDEFTKHTRNCKESCNHGLNIFISILANGIMEKLKYITKKLSLLGIFIIILIFLPKVNARPLMSFESIYSDCDYLKIILLLMITSLIILSLKITNILVTNILKKRETNNKVVSLLKEWKDDGNNKLESQKMKKQKSNYKKPNQNRTINNEDTDTFDESNSDHIYENAAELNNTHNKMKLRTAIKRHYKMKNSFSKLNIKLFIINFFFLLIKLIIIFFVYQSIVKECYGDKDESVMINSEIEMSNSKADFKKDDEIFHVFKARFTGDNMFDDKKIEKYEDCSNNECSLKMILKDEMLLHEGKEISYLIKGKKHKDMNVNIKFKSLTNICSYKTIYETFDVEQISSSSDTCTEGCDTCLDKVDLKTNKYKNMIVFNISKESSSSWSCDGAGCMSINSGCTCGKCYCDEIKGTTHNVMSLVRQNIRMTLCLNLGGKGFCKDINDFSVNKYFSLIKTESNNQFKCHDRIACNLKNVCLTGEINGKSETDDKFGSVQRINNEIYYKEEIDFSEVCLFAQHRSIKLNKCCKNSYYMLNNLKMINSTISNNILYVPLRDAGLWKLEVQLPTLKYQISDSKPKITDFKLLTCRGCFNCEEGGSCLLNVKSDKNDLASFKCNKCILDSNNIVLSKGQNRIWFNLFCNEMKVSLNCSINNNITGAINANFIEMSKSIIGNNHLNIDKTKLESHICKTFLCLDLGSITSLFRNFSIISTIKYAIVIMIIVLMTIMTVKITRIVLTNNNKTNKRK